ncbi:unnamed protein product [Brassica oleracea var. botrytis]
MCLTIYKITMEEALKPNPSLTFQILRNTTPPFTRGKHTQRVLRKIISFNQ